VAHTFNFIQSSYPQADEPIIRANTRILFTLLGIIGKKLEDQNPLFVAAEVSGLEYVYFDKILINNITNPASSSR